MRHIAFPWLVIHIPSLIMSRGFNKQNSSPWLWRGKRRTIIKVKGQSWGHFTPYFGNATHRLSMKWLYIFFLFIRNATVKNVMHTEHEAGYLRDASDFLMLFRTYGRTDGRKYMTRSFLYDPPKLCLLCVYISMYRTDRKILSNSLQTIWITFRSRKKWFRLMKVWSASMV